MPKALHDRAADCWRPLFAIADCVGGTGRTHAREAAKAISGAEDEANSPLRFCCSPTCGPSSAREMNCSSADLVKALRALDSRPWATWGKDDKGLTSYALARLLKDFVIHPLKIRFGTNGKRLHPPHVRGRVVPLYPCSNWNSGTQPIKTGPNRQFRHPNNRNTRKPVPVQKMQVRPITTGVVPVFHFSRGESRQSARAMTTLDLLAAARTIGILLQAHGDRLHVEAPPGIVTPEFRAALVEQA